MSIDTTEIVYDALNFDGLERRANYRTVAYRIDMLHIFDRKDAAAILYEIIYRWQFETRRSLVLQEIERRKKTGQTPLMPEEVEAMMWVYMSYNTFVRESGGAVGYNTVIRTLDYLVDDIKTLERQENHDPNYPDYEYRINKEVARKLLKALPVQPVFTPKVPKKKAKSTQTGTPNGDSTQMGTGGNQSTQMGTGSTQTGIPTTQMGTGVYPNGGTSHTTHILPTHTSSQSNEGSVSAFASTPHIHLSQMANDVLFVQLTIYQHEQLDYGYDHLHIAGKDGKCCLACEREAMVCVVDDMQHEVKRITDKHKVVNLTTLPGDETELDDTVEDIRGKHNRPLTYDTHLAVADATNQPQGDTHNVQHDHGSPGDDARSSAGIDTAHISGNPGVASIPPAHTVVAQDTPPTESGDPVLTGEQTLDGATAARFPPGSKSRASGNAPARSRTGEKPPKPAKSVKQEPLLPPDKPDMSGAWLAEKCVQYAEWGNKMRYRESEHTRQLEAARAIHRDDPDVTLTQFADAYDERHDAWWLENRGKLHVSELKAKEKNSGIDRLHVMLDRIVAREAKRCNGGRNGTNGTGKPPSSVGYDGKTDLNVYGIQALLREQEAKRGVM